MQGTFTVKSRYLENESRSYIVVSVQDQEVLQVVSVTRSTPNTTHFLVVVQTHSPGDTAWRVQLWDHARNLTALTLVIILPVVLLNKCAFGCKIEPEILCGMWWKPLPVIFGAAIQFILMPFRGFLLTRVWQLPQALAFGFILTCTCPGGGGGYLYTLLLDGDIITLAISMTCSLTVLSLFAMPAV
ncbi:sodium/bile acid cotransporter 5-like [Lissotriton helveticus]